MYVVRKLSTRKVHITVTADSHKTLCGQACQSNVINDLNNGFATIKNTDEILNVPEVTCERCLKLYKK